MNLLTVRCSSLPIVCRCPAATVVPDLTIEGDDAPARLGSAVHEVMPIWIVNNFADETQAIIAAGKWGCDPNEVVRLSWQGWAAWQKLKQHFPAPECERSLELTTTLSCESCLAPEVCWCGKPARQVRLTGHPDITSVTEDGSAVYILDHKTGWRDGDHLAQMRGYGLLGLTAAPTAVKVFVGILRVREGTVEWLSFDRVSLFLWWSRVVESFAETDSYRAGPHCAYCPRAHECPARGQLLSNAVTTIGSTALTLHNDGPKMMARKLADVLDRVKLIEGACDLAKEQIKAEVARRGGRVDAGDGRELVLVPNRRRELDAAKAWQVLTEFPQEKDDAEAFPVYALSDLLTIIGIGVGDLEKLIMADAPRGQKTKVLKKVMTRLAEAGAVIEKQLAPKLEVKTHGNSNATIPADGKPAALATNEAE